MLVGVDIGGTFTDFVVSVDGSLRVHKLLSTPDDPARAMLAGLRETGPQGLGAIARIVHGSTVATNAILERKGARTALIATQGFRDILAIGRQDRPHLYALQPRLPPPLIPRKWCYQVPERLDHTGQVLVPLDLAELDAVLDDIALQGIESIAVCLLYSYLNPAHENAIRARILERGLLQAEQIALSCEVLPEFREYERASTVALEAYVCPVVSGYLKRLEKALQVEEEGAPDARSLRIMKSDGGIVSARRARQQAIQTVLSGPAAGVIGAFSLAQQAGYENVITLDIGGTSTDVALCPGRWVRSVEWEIDGLPLRTGVLDIQTIGAGGGSIARLDAGGALRVGPDSAGADPGPIAYGLGGQHLTVTDANAVLGRLDARHFLGGAMPLHTEPARVALGSLGRQMGLSAEGAALGIIDVTNVHIDGALRKASVARGYDPRSFTLVAFGGAGPLHACEVAAGLDIPQVLIPRYPGVLCALGLLMADVVFETSRSVLTPVTDATEAEMRARLQDMVRQARADLARESAALDAMVFDGSVDARYRGQSYELTVPFDDSATCDLAGAFHAAHARSYGHALPDRQVEAVNLRLRATGIVRKLPLIPEQVDPNDGAGARIGSKLSVSRLPDHRTSSAPSPGKGTPLTSAQERVALYERRRLDPGAEFHGPALVFQMDSTVYIAAGWSARVDGYRNLILEQHR